jgi:hypothetical protein
VSKRATAAAWLHRRAEQAPLAAVWAAGAALTAVGMYSVAVACGIPGNLAWLYPLIFDGLALVAYRATSHTKDGARRYAAFVVMLCTGLSATAQAAHLAAGDGLSAGADGHLKAGVGAAPAIAVALAAHLHWLTTKPATTQTDASTLPGGVTGPGGTAKIPSGPVPSITEGADADPGTAGRERTASHGRSSLSPAPELVPALAPPGAGTSDPGRSGAVPAGRAHDEVAEMDNVTWLKTPPDTRAKTAVPAVSGQGARNGVSVRADTGQDTPPGQSADSRTAGVLVARTDTQDSVSADPAETAGQQVSGQPDPVSAALLSGLSVRDVVRATGATKSHVEKCRGELVAAGQLSPRGRA